jgi:hypothetical protein
MSFYTDWFIASEDQAHAIASIITTEEHSLEDWPHIALKNIGVVELMRLWSILLKKKFDPTLSVTSRLLLQVSEEGPFVMVVAPEFIQLLAGIHEADVPRYASIWGNAEEFTRWSTEELIDVLRQLSAFAQQAVKEKKPVLEMAVI